jgi:hypothetical protein
MKTKLLAVFLALTLFFPLANAQTVLEPGEKVFTVKSMIISALQLQGNYSTTGSYYLNIYWNSYYIVGTGDIGAICYLNCNPKTADCSSAKNCSYLGPTGNAVCTIINPSYNFYGDNIVICKFYDPATPDIPYEPYPNKPFRPVAFSVWLFGVTSTIGKEFSLQTNVKNTGLFDDRYNVTVSTPTPNILAIQNPEAFVGPLKGDSYLNVPETGASYTRLTVLTDEPCVCITVNSTVKADIPGSYNMDSTGCPANCVKIKSKLASLPDFGFLGILQIILLAGILAYLNFK